VFSQATSRLATCAPGRLRQRETRPQGGTVTLHTAILINAILDLGIVLAVAATMLFPFTLDRSKDDAAIYSFAADLPEDLAA
jgi:hypothetical protein